MASEVGVMKIIVIDPGHGGDDAGATLGKRLEKDDNLRLALALRKKLPSEVKTVLTRDSDVFIPPLQRRAVSHSAGANVFISLHRNCAAHNPAAGGAEIWLQSGSPPVNLAYAKNVLDGIEGVGAFASRGIKEGNFQVLRHNSAPAMLLEMGFISNSADNRIFDLHLEAYAAAIGRSLLKSLGLSQTAPRRPSAAVGFIQQTLNNRYNAALVTDGLYGEQTKRALVRSLQSELNRRFKAGLAPDGLFGPGTKAALPNIGMGHRGNIVWLLQAALNANGHPTAMDGVFGPRTAQIVRNLQNVVGLPPNGIANGETFEKLF